MARIISVSTNEGARISTYVQKCPQLDACSILINVMKCPAKSKCKPPVCNFRVIVCVGIYLLG